jgi:hypothetical protein
MVFAPREMFGETYASTPMKESSPIEIGGRVRGNVVSRMSCEPAHRWALVSIRTRSPKVIVPSVYKMTCSATWQSSPTFRFQGTTISTLRANEHPRPTLAPNKRRTRDLAQGQQIHTDFPTVPHKSRMIRCRRVHIVLRFGGASSIAAERSWDRSCLVMSSFVFIAISRRYYRIN